MSEVSTNSIKGYELRGRHRIYTDVEEITEKNVIQVLSDAMIKHEVNRAEISYLLKYEKGEQPLKRKKEIRKDINIEVCDNIANQVTEFKLGYNWGNPITYVQRGDKDIASSDASNDDNAVSMLNEMNEAEGAAAKDQELARYIEICGIGYQMVDIKRNFEDESVFDLITLNPLFTFCIYRNSARQEKLAGVTYRITQSGDRYFTVITPDTRFEIKNGIKIINGNEKNKWNFSNRNGEKNPLGKIPIVEFIRSYDRMGCFERQLSDMDSLNIEVSDFANNVAQKVQEIWWGNDFEFPTNETTGEQQAPEGGQWVMTKTAPNGKAPSIKPLSSQFDYQGVQANIESKRSLILQKCYVPMQSEPGGGSTGSAMSMSSGWTAAEASACKEELIVSSSKLEIVRLELLAIKKSPDTKSDSPLFELRASDIKPKFTRQKTYDLGTKTNAMVTMIKNGIHGRIAMQTVDLFPDIAQAWNDSKDLIEEYQKSLFEKSQESSNSDSEKRDQSDLTDQVVNSPIIDGMNMENPVDKTTE